MRSSRRLRNSGLKTFLASSVSLLLHRVVVGVLGGAAAADGAEAHGGLLLDQLGADVGRHDDDGVAEVDLAAERVGDGAFLQDLEEEVHHIGVGLFDLVEQHDRVRAAAHGLGELAAFLVADVAREASR